MKNRKIDKIELKTVFAIEIDILVWSFKERFYFLEYSMSFFKSFLCIIKSNLIQHAKYEALSSNKTKGLKAPSPVSLEHFVYPHRLYKIYFKNQNINTYTKKSFF